MKLTILVEKTSNCIRLHCKYFIFTACIENGSVVTKYTRNRSETGYWNYKLNPTFGNWACSFFTNIDVLNAIPTGVYTFVVDSTVNHDRYYKSVTIYKPQTDNLYFIGADDIVYRFFIKRYLSGHRDVKLVAFDTVTNIPADIAFETKMHLYFHKYIEEKRVVFKLLGYNYVVNSFHFIHEKNTKQLYVNFGVNNSLTIDVDDIKRVKNLFHLNTGQLSI